MADENNSGRFAAVGSGDDFQAAVRAEVARQRAEEKAEAERQELEALVASIEDKQTRSFLNKLLGRVVAAERRASAAEAQAAAAKAESSQNRLEVGAVAAGYAQIAQNQQDLDEGQLTKKSRRYLKNSTIAWGTGTAGFITVIGNYVIKFLGG